MLSTKSRCAFRRVVLGRWSDAVEQCHGLHPAHRLQAHGEAAVYFTSLKWLKKA
jgi:hypothetical protein